MVHRKWKKDYYEVYITESESHSNSKNLILKSCGAQRCSAFHAFKCVISEFMPLFSSCNIIGENYSKVGKLQSHLFSEL